LLGWAEWRKNRLRSVVLQRIGGSVLRTTNPQPSLWETILPAELLGLPAELAPPASTPVAITGDVEACTRPGSLHPQGALLEW
jgi:hypothetical protein